MSIPNRFDTNISSTGGVVEVKTLKTSSGNLDVQSLISNFELYTKYIPTELVLKNILYQENNVFKSLDENYSFDINAFKQSIIDEVNLSVDTNTGYVYYTKDSSQNEIKLSNAAYLDGKKIEDVSGNLILDVDSLNNEISSINLKYDSTNNKLVDFKNNTIVENITQINSLIDSNANKITAINLKYDSSKNELIDNDGNAIVENVTQINSLIDSNANKISAINLKYDSSKNELIDNAGNGVLNTNEVNNRIENTSNEIIYNVSLDSSGNVTTEKILDYNSALSFKADSSNIDISIDTTKLVTKSININLTPSIDPSGKNYIGYFSGITKDSSGNITGFKIGAVKLDGTAENNYTLGMLIKYV